MQFVIIFNAAVLLSRINGRKLPQIPPKQKQRLSVHIWPVTSILTVHSSGQGRH